MADGKITFSTKLDNADLHKQLKQTEKEIENALTAKGKATEAKIPLEKQLEEMKPKLEQAKRDLEEYQQRVADAQKVIADPNASGEDKAAAKEALKEDLRRLEGQEKEVAKIQEAWNNTTKRVEQYNAEIERQEQLIQDGENRAGGIMQQLERANGPFSAAMENARGSMQAMEKALIRMAKRVFVFQVITKALRSARQYFGKLLSTNTEFQAQMTKLRTALATAFQPLYEAAVPVLITILRLLTQIVTVAAQALSAIFGKSLSQSARNAAALNSQAQALQDVGGAAAEAKKQLMGFDEINQLQNDSGGGGGGTSNTAQFNFEDIEDAGITEEKLNRILGIVGAIGAALMTWKISKILPEMLGTITTKLGGILFAIGGILLFVDGFKDASENGMNLYNTLEMVGGLIAGGLGISVLVGGWIPLLIGAVAAVLLALAYFTGHGEELINGLKQTFDGLCQFVQAIADGDWSKAMEGLSSAWAGFVSATDAVLDSLVDGFAALMDWLNELTGGKFEGVFNGLKEAWSGYIKFYEDILSGDVFTMEYWVGVFNRIGEAFGVVNLVGVMQGAWADIVNWWNTTIAPIFTLEYWQTKFEQIGAGIEAAKATITLKAQEIWTAISSWWSENVSPKFTLEYWKGVFANIVDAIANLPIVTKAKELWNEVKKWWTEKIMPMFTLDYWIEKFSGIGEGLMEALKNGINAGVALFNQFISWINDHMSFSWGSFEFWGKEVIPAGSFQLFTIPPLPMLAQGAVIPPNAPFAAILGDQRNGNNIEAPEDLIRKIVREETGGNGRVEELLQTLISVVSGIKIGDETIGRAARRDDWIYARTGR